MQILKKISLLGIILTCQSIYAGDDHQKIEAIEFLPYTTDKYIYTKSTSSESSLYTYMFGNQLDGTSKEDSTRMHVFNNGLTRTKITRITEHGNTQYITEIWTTRNPSYITWTNTTITLSCATLLGLTVTLVYGLRALQDHTNPHHPFFVRLYGTLKGAPQGETDDYLLELEGKKDRARLHEDAKKLGKYLRGLLQDPQ